MYFIVSDDEDEQMITIGSIVTVHVSLNRKCLEIIINDEKETIDLSNNDIELDNNNDQIKNNSSN